MQRAKHSRTFGLIYGSPKQRNNHRCIIICIYFFYFAICVCTLKNLVSPFANMFAAMACLGCITRINSNNFYSIHHTFISQKRTQLREIPFTKLCSKSFISIFRSKTNVSQIFNRNSLFLFFSTTYNRLCNSMVYYCCRIFFSPTKPFQKSFRRLRAFGLNGTTNPLFLFSIFIKPFSRMFFTIRSYCNISKSEIYTNKFFNIFDFFIRNFNSLKQVKFTFVQNQISLSFYVRQIILIMADKFNSFQSTINSPNRNGIIKISQNSTIISDSAKWLEFTLNFFINFITIRNLTYATYNHLSRKIEAFFNNMVSLFMYLKLIENSLFKRNVRNIIKSRISFNQSVFQRLKLRIIREQFYFQREFHITNIIHIFEK